MQPARHNFDTKEEWLGFHAGKIGASQAATIVGMNPYSGPIDAYMQITGLATVEENMAMRVGLAAEGLLKRLFCQDTGNGLQGLGCGHNNLEGAYREGYNDAEYRYVWKDEDEAWSESDAGDGYKYASWQHVDHPWMICTPDDLLVAPIRVHGGGVDWGAGLECKMIGMGSAKDWTEDEPSVMAEIQARHSMAVMQMDRWYIIALIGTKYHIYTVDRDLEIEGKLVAALAAFYNDHIAPNIAPELDASKASGEYLRITYPRETGEMITATGDDQLELLNALQQIKVNAKNMADVLMIAENKIKDMIGTAPGVEWPGGRITWKAQKGRERIDSRGMLAALKDGYPELATTLEGQYVGRGAPFRVLRPKFAE